MAITRDDVRRVAQLARLRLDDAEEARLATDLDHILEAFAQLQAVDTSGVEPTTSVEEFEAYLRDDARVGPPADDALLAGAPARDGRLFRVPKIIE